MNFKTINNIPLFAIVKINLYLNGIIVSNELYDILNNSQYSGYRTTSGLFMKIGGTLSKKEFEHIKENNIESNLLADIDEFTSFEEYLKVREYVTVKLNKVSDFSDKELSNNTFFKLDTNNGGKLYIVGQVICDENKYEIRIDDCGFFKQGNYNDRNEVVIQAGGIRIRTSICGSNCISGCKFCDFGRGFNNYRKDTFNEKKRNNINSLINKFVLKQKISSLFITGGNPSLEDMHNWTDFVESSIDTFYSTLRMCSDINGEVDVMLTPRGFDKYVYSEDVRYYEYKKYLTYLKSIGVTTISPNMELWSQKDLDKFCPPNGKVIGTSKSEIAHGGYLDFIRAGIEVLGKFNVRISLITGLSANKNITEAIIESKENIKEAIRTLIPMGCYVVLSPFKAPRHKVGDLRYGEDLKPYEMSVKDLIELSNYLKDILDKYLKSLPTKISDDYKKCINNSLKAHNSHNTANLCCGQYLDIIEKKALFDEVDNTIVSNLYCRD